MNKLNNLPKFFLTCSFLIISLFSIGQLPKEFPSVWKNKVVCGKASTTGKMVNGSTAFLDFPFQLFISDDGIRAMYNPDEKFGRDSWGSTQMIKKLVEFKRVSQYDQYGDIKGYVIYYKTPDAYLTNHGITSITLDLFLDKSKSSVLTVGFNVNSYKDATVNSLQTNLQICGSIPTAAEILQEQKSKQKIDSQKYSSINKLVANKSYDLANLELDKLNYPKEYPNYEKIKNESAKAAVEAASKLEKEKEKQDEIIANQINTLINEKKIFEASTKFSELNFPDNHSTLKVKIITELQTESKKQVIVFQTEKLNKLVELNKDQIKLLSTGNHILKVDGNGFVFIDGKETSIKTNPEIEQYGKNGYFKSPVSAECPLNITETKTNLGEEKMLVSSKKQIYSSLSGKIYEGSFFKTGLFSTIKVVQINYTVPKKHYQIIQPIERKMYANGIIILDEKINQLVKEKKFANRTYKVISRASVLVVGSFYGILRIYETSLLPK